MGLSPPGRTGAGTELCLRSGVPAYSLRHNPDANHPDSLRLVPLTIIFHAISQETCTENAEGTLARSRAADDFPAIRARMEELKRERAGTTTNDDTQRRDAPLPYAVNSRPGTTDRSGISPQLHRGLLGGRSA